jgi:hypothetical protein
MDSDLVDAGGLIELSAIHYCTSFDHLNRGLYWR